MANPFENHPVCTLMQTWHQACHEGDMDTISALMAEDALFLVPDQPPITRANFLESFGLVRQTIRLQILEWRLETLEEAGNLAYVQSYLHLGITPKVGGAALQRKGFILSIFRKQATGQWVLVRDANFLSTLEG